MNSAWCILLVAVVCIIGPTRVSSKITKLHNLTEIKERQDTIETPRVHELVINGTKSHGKHRRVEVVIPADARLETPEFSGEIEEELGHAKLGKNSKKRKRHEKI